MKRITALIAVVVAALVAPNVLAQNLLTNGNLNSLIPEPPGSPFYETPTGWNISTNPQSFPQPGNPNPPIVRYPTFPAGFAEHANPGGPGVNGVVLNSTEGNFPGFPDVLTVDGDLTQSVPAIPGAQYEMKGWAYFEGGYAGGVDNLDPSAPNGRGGLPSLTDTFFALEFLDGLGVALPGSVVVELKANGQVNNPDQTEATRNWLQHTLIGVAPLGAVSVQVRASMVDGEFNIDLPHQAAWIDDFSLRIVPEPSSCILVLSALALTGAARRRRR